MLSGLSTFAWIHTLLSLVALVAGVVVVKALLEARVPETWTAVYLGSAVLTSATGFGFPFTTFGPSHWIGVFSLIVLAGAILALYVFRLEGAWRWIFAAGAVLGLYFDFFVLIAQAFMKVPALHALAPTLGEPPFALAQLALAIVFAAVLYLSLRRFQPAAA